MTINADELKKAFAPITKINADAEPAPIDLEKVAVGVLTEAQSFVTGDDPMANLDAMCKRVDQFDSLLDGAYESEDGTVFVSGSNEIAKDFAPEKQAKGEDEAKGGGSDDKKKKPAFLKDKEADAKKDGDTAKGEESGEADTAKGDESEGGEETDTAKGDDEDVTWEDDLAPKQLSTLRSARLTKSERIIPARAGARAQVEKKYQRARDRAKGRGEDRATT